MNIGMLWYDNDQEKELQAKVKEACLYYDDKYQTPPNRVFVHPSMLTEPEARIDVALSFVVTVKPSKQVLPNYFWIGRETK